jgi:molybdate transport system substrate-binding protein
VKATVVIVVAFALVLTGCTSSADAHRGENEPLTIFAAASLVASFDELVEEFALEHPSITVAPVVYDGSSTLATQIREGAPADVFASADRATMAGIDTPGPAAVFATNTLTIAVAPGNPLKITGIAELADRDLAVVLCAAAVPCGAASASLLALDGVTVTPVSEEQSVTAVLTKVALGEADAGLVYTTDVLAAGDEVDAVAAEGADSVVSEYPIAVLRDAANPAAARAFVAWVHSAAGRGILAKHGFGAPL